MANKNRYRVRNWAQYSKSLINRGSISVRFDEEVVAKWHATERNGKRGRPQNYTNIAILCSLTFRSLFKLPLRATKGFVGSLILLLDLPLSAPDYTTLSRRQGTLKLPAYCSTNPSESVHLVVDSSGLKLYGEGESRFCVKNFRGDAYR